MDYDSNALRIFCRVFETKNFSLAAKELGLSQPSVSQMIARLEEKLGNLLFERIGRTIAPTRLANDLYRFSIDWLERLDSFTQHLQNDEVSTKGRVRFAKPESCLWTPQYAAILKQLGDLKEISIDIDIVENDKIISGVLEDRYDFGFIVGERLSSELRFETFGEESYVAVQSAVIRNKPSFAKGETLRVVTYPGWETYFKIWINHHGLLKTAKTWEIHPVVNVGSLAGALKAVSQGAAFSVLPLQCISDSLKQKELTLIDPVSSKTYASSPVYLVKRRSYLFPSRVELVVKKLRETRRA